MQDLNCPNCGTTKSSVAPGICDCCGFEFTKEFIDEFTAAEKKKEIEIQANIEKEKERQKKEEKELQRQRELEAKRKKEEAEALAKERARIKKLELEEAERIRKIERKKKSAETLKKVSNFGGFILSGAFLAVIVANSIIMSQTTGMIGGWIFFLVLVVASIFVSIFAYMCFNEKLVFSTAYTVPSGIIAAFVISCALSNSWINLVVDTFKGGFFNALFFGVFSICVFLVFSILVIGISLAITVFLASFIQSKTSDMVGGLIGLTISAVAASLYLIFVDPIGVPLVLGHAI